MNDSLCNLLGHEWCLFPRPTVLAECDVCGHIYYYNSSGDFIEVDSRRNFISPLVSVDELPEELLGIVKNSGGGIYPQ